MNNPSGTPMTLEDALLLARHAVSVRQNQEGLGPERIAAIEFLIVHASTPAPVPVMSIPLPESKPEEFTDVALLTGARNTFQAFVDDRDNSGDVRKWWAQRVAAIDAWLARLDGEPIPLIDSEGWSRQFHAFAYGIDVSPDPKSVDLCLKAAQFAVNRCVELIPQAVAAERYRLLNTPEISDFARGVVLEALHQRERWSDEGKNDVDWHGVATYLAAKALVNPPQNDGTTGEHARLHRLVALGALVANWHAAVLARPEETT